jgi:hypothetical protein
MKHPTQPPITLFLDFDGVLNNDRFLRHQKNHVPPRERRLFDPANLEALDALCVRLPVERIVVTSTWRKGRTLEELQRLLGAEGLQASQLIQDVTVSLGPQPEARAAEIAEWVSRNTPQRILVLDDWELRIAAEEGFYRVDARSGLTLEVVKDLVQRLSSN